MMAHALAVATCLIFASAEPSGSVENSHIRVIADEQSFAWYDGATGQLRPILPAPDLGGGRLQAAVEWIASKLAWVPRMFRGIGRWLRGLNIWRIPGVGGLGDLIAIGLVLLVLAALVVILMELLRRYRPPVAAPISSSVTLRAGEGSRIEGLPAGAGFDASDPWAEATRRRARGDYSGAIIYLFAYQLLALNRLNAIRLIPGRTGRQLVRSVGDRQLRGWVEPTLRLFEAVYYGHRPPSPEAFEAAWVHAQAFQERVAGQREAET
jgi:Domain of unknown function (DUF4129)